MRKRSKLVSGNYNVEPSLTLVKRPGYELSKRLFDICFALVGLVLVSPVMITIALVIKFTSKGPVFYKGLRTGRYGKTFYIIKFRSMLVGADKGAGTTSRNDARITSIGRVIRRTKLDELPQLFNVLIGEMSFVGPRPELPRYTKQYQSREKLILLVPPGITDYSSLHFSNLNDLIGDDDPDTAFETKILAEKNRLRVMYVDKRSFFNDSVLIINTLLRVMKVK